MNKQGANGTLEDFFYILAFSKTSVKPIIVIVCCLVMYLMSVYGNLLITCLVCLASNLHTPMYMFLCNLSIQDIVYISSFLPKLIAITLTGDTSISFYGCIIQNFMFVFCVDVEFFLLTAMAYDRYVAICRPLHYSTIMNNRLCFLMSISCWIAAWLNGLVHSLLVSQLSFCRSHEINHIFCELKSLLKLSCSDTSHIITMLVTEVLLLGLVPLLLILSSYMFIISAVLKIRTTAGRLKTFSSCFSHIVVVILFCGSCIGTYLKKEPENSQEQYKIHSLFYIAVVPMINPLVYSLRNTEVLMAMTIVLRHFTQRE